MTTADEMESFTIGGIGNFEFSATRIDNLGEVQYTLVTIAVDVTGSTRPFATDLKNMLVTAVESCNKAPSPANLMIRALLFSTEFVGGTKELHGFKLLCDINPQKDYSSFTPKGNTPLYDAVYSAIGATTKYGSELVAGDYRANGIVVIITDGLDNASVATRKMIRGQIEEVQLEKSDKPKLESLLTILVGVIDEKRDNSEEWRQYYERVRQELQAFKDEASIDHYIELKDVTKSAFAKLAAFVSRSVSSTQVALGTGGPSKQIAPTI